MNTKGKGVVALILPDEFMPVDEDGYRADIIMSPQANVNRMNPSQLIEQVWNRCADQVIRNIKAAKMNWKQAYRYILDFINEFRPAYAQALDTILLEKEEKKQAWVEQILETGIIRLMAAWKKPWPRSKYIEICKKYGVKASRVTYKDKDPETGEIITTTTARPALIGSKYLMFLGKMAEISLSAVSASHVNQFEIPIKPKSKRIKEQSIVGQTPMRFGEDEVCLLSMSLGPVATSRMMCIHSASPVMAKNMINTLLTAPHPSRVISLPYTSQRVMNENRTVSILNNMFGAIGYDIRAQTAYENKK